MVETVEVISTPPLVPPAPVPEQSSTDQVKSVLHYIEETVGLSKMNFFRDWKENGDISKKDPLFTAWFTLATELDRRFYSNKSKRKRKSEQPRLNDSYINHHDSTNNIDQISFLNNNTIRSNPSQNGMIDLNSTAGYLPTITPTSTSTGEHQCENQPNSEEEMITVKSASDMVGEIYSSPPLIEKSVNLIKPHPRKTMMLSFNSMK